MICSAVALLLAVVNMVTKEKIDENTAKEKQEAVERIFEEAEVFPLEGYDHEILLVAKNSELIGYTVTVKPQGYGGEIEILVGINKDGAIEGVEIVTLSETPGVGSRVKTDERFLPQFKGKSGTLVAGENVDAISGASISSKAVISGINEALSVEVDLEGAASALGISAGSSAQESTDSESVVTTEAAETTEAATEETTAAAPETNIDPSLVGGASDGLYHPGDNIDVVADTEGYYLEPEITDAESDTGTPEGN